jgi:hypothetical protein
MPVTIVCFLMRPLHVLTSVIRAAALARELAGEGWHVHEGFVLPDEPWDVAASTTLLVGYVDDVTAAADAVLAAERGAGVIATVDSGSDVEALLVADLSRIGPVTRS